MKKNKKVIIIIGIIIVLLLAAILIMALRPPGYQEPNKTTDTWSSSLTNRDEKMAFLAEYLVMQSEIIDAEYHIVYHDNSDGRIPGPSDWDVRVALKVATEDMPLWLDGFVPVDPQETDLSWWEGLASDIISWNGDGEYYKRENDFSYLVAFPEAGVILKAISTMPYSINSSAEEAPPDSLRIKAAIADHLPIFTIEITKLSEQTVLEVGTEYTYRADISCKEKPELISQSFILFSCEALTEDMISFVDIDCDGYLDMEVIYYGAGIANRTLQYYRWNVFEGKAYGQFEETPFFSMLASGYKIYPDTKQIIATTRSSAASYARKMYQLTNTRNCGWLGTYDLVRTEDVELSSGNEENTYTVTVRIFGSDKEIYTLSMTQEEYFDISPQRDNYLRFGSDEAIGATEAYSILIEKYGTKMKCFAEVETELEYPLSYRFEEMVLIDNLSCYSFRMSWLVDNNHWSYVDNIFVTPEGVIILSNGSIFNP